MELPRNSNFDMDSISILKLDSLESTLIYKSCWMAWGNQLYRGSWTWHTRKYKLNKTTRTPRPSPRAPWASPGTPRTPWALPWAQGPRGRCLGPQGRLGHCFGPQGPRGCHHRGRCCRCELQGHPHGFHFIYHFIYHLFYYFLCS